MPADQAYNMFRRLMSGPTAQPPGIDYANPSVDIRVYGVDMNQYSFDVSHNYLSSIPVGARICSGVLQNKTVGLNGAWNADTLVIPQVSGGTFHAWIFVLDTGNPATSPLLFKIDSYSNMPVTPNGGDITLRFPTDSNKIVRP